MPISLKRTETGSEPLTLEQAKLHLRIDTDYEDDLVTSLITAARIRAEQITGRCLVASDFVLSLDSFPYIGLSSNSSFTVFPPARTSYQRWVGAWQDAVSIYLPCPPLVAVNSIKYAQSVAGDGTITQATVDPSVYVVDADSVPARVTPAYSKYWPMALAQPKAVQVAYSAGYADSIPEPISAGIKLILSWLYEQRSDSDKIPKAAEYILSAHQVHAASLLDQ